VTWGVDYASVDGQHPPDFAALARAGCSFVWLRASFGAYDSGHKAWRLLPDATFARDWHQLTGHFVRGAYMGPAIMASHSPEEQVGVFKAAVDAQGGFMRGVDLPPCLDVEFPQGIAGTGMTRSQVVAWIETAVAEMRRLFGVAPIIYTSARVWDGTDTDCLGSPSTPDLLDCPLWLARYLYPARQPAVLPPPESSPPCPHQWADEWVAHQDQGDALGVPGLSSTTDIDRWRPAKLGDRGGHVTLIQKRLHLPTDGVFGPQTRNAVFNFQAAHGLAQDGEVGIHTGAALLWE